MIAIDAALRAVDEAPSPPSSRATTSPATTRATAGVELGVGVAVGGPGGVPASGPGVALAVEPDGVVTFEPQTLNRPWIQLINVGPNLFIASIRLRTL